MAAITSTFSADAPQNKPTVDAPATSPSPGLEQITFGSGCFWCTEAVFSQLKGVKSAVSGYSGGQVDNPTYEQVCGGRTGHAEVIQVTYDPQEVSLATLLEAFWKTHDPTTLNRQGADVGTQYRSAIFYHTEEQRQAAVHYKQKLDEAQAFDGPIVTEITKFAKFYPAEKYHQEYFEQNPGEGYCRAVIQPKVDKFRQVFADKLKGAAGGKSEAAIAPAGGEKVDWSKVDWKKRLTPEQYAVTRQAGTERAFTGEYWNLFQPGQYRCSNCGLPLFDGESKFDSHCGWPSFDKALAKDSVTEHADNAHGMVRTEVRCRRCGAHLGHIFDDGPTKTGMRYCMNSVSLKFMPTEEQDAAKSDKKAEQSH